MLALAEYLALKAELEALGKRYDQRMLDELRDLPKYAQRTNAQLIGADYINDLRELLDAGMFEVATTATKHYAQELGEMPEDTHHLPSELASRQWNDKYYGYNLAERLMITKRVLHRRIANSSTLDAYHKVFIPRIPYGSQTAFDRRLMLGMFAKIENDAARDAAERNDVPFIKWTLSHRHAKPDECDDLATAVDRRVEQYLIEHKLDADSKGLYFRDELPLPPHPNCQCEYQLVTPGERTTRTRVRRAINKVRNLLKRIRGK